MKIEAKKSLGQNWLNSDSAINKIVGAGDIQPSDTILEIGPGRGVLTKALLTTGAKVMAIEKDHQLIGELENIFKSEIESGQLQLIEGDILQMSERLGLKNSNYKVIANIPYYITGELLRLFLEINHQPTRMVLMVQKEVATRIIARDGKASILSNSIKVYGTPKIIATIPAGAFVPKPKVDSAILAITDINRRAFDSTLTEQKFFTVVKQGFAQKRKKLKNNLSCPAEVLIQCGLDPNTRAENLSVEQWLCLAKHL